MILRNKILAAIAAVALTTGAFAAADQTGERKSRREARVGARGQFLNRIATQLELTEAQKQYAQTLFRENREAAKPIMQQLRQGREAMAAAVKANNEAEITRLAGEQAQLMAQARALHAKGLAKFYAQLTTEQKAKADEMFNRLQNRFGHAGRRG